MPKLPRCKNGTRRNKKTKQCEPSHTKTKKTTNTNTKTKTKTKRTANNDSQYISQHELEQILREINLSPAEMEEIKSSIERLKHTRFTKRYKSCFTGNPTRDAEDMVRTKLQCWTKYRDPF